MGSLWSVLPTSALTDPGLSDAEFRVLFALASFANTDRRCFPSIKTIGTASRKSDRAVQRALSRLVTLGYVVKELRWGRSTVYVIKHDTPATNDTPVTNGGGGVTAMTGGGVIRGTHNSTTEQSQRTSVRLGGDVDRSELLAYATRITTTANTALKNNPRMSLGVTQLKPLQTHLAVQLAEDWAGEGIPETVVLEVIQRVCGAFQPSKENPRIGSFRYFDTAVRKAWAESKSGVNRADQEAEMLKAMEAHRA